ncbi:MAG: TatD family hydrolase [Acidimicrobiia bacterium]|nr:TatD family hydrolase [Acidimicrobiia bacterium]
MWFDNHCHLHHRRVNADEAAAAARAAGVSRMITVGCSLEDSRLAIEVAGRLGDVWATAGVHPHDASEGVEGLEELLAHRSVVAVGEAGLDYHYDRSPREAQREVFRRQIALANRRGKALVIHTREAWDDTFALLDAEGIPPRTVFHCFTGGPDELVQCLARGASVSFSGIVTFPSAPEVLAAARLAPPERILVETDSPYLAPVPFRGKPNQPAHVAVVGAFLAAERGVPDAELARMTTANTLALYGIGVDDEPRREPGPA